MSYGDEDYDGESWTGNGWDLALVIVGLGIALLAELFEIVGAFRSKK